MTDREKVIMGLACIAQQPNNGVCGECAYFRPFRDDPDCGWCDKVAIANDALALLREQEPVKPHRNYKYLSDFWCDCGWHLGRSRSVNFCPECGRKVKWDG